MTDNLAQKIHQAIIWTTIGRFGAQVFSWLATIFVIRWLTPQDYGLLAMGESVWVLLYGIANLGLGERLIQRKNADHKDYQQVLSVLLMVAIAFTSLMFVGAQAISDYFNDSEIHSVIHALAPLILLVPFLTLFNAHLSRQMAFKPRAKIDLAVAVITATTTLTLAILGFGVWSLIAGMYVDQIGKCLAYGYLCKLPLRPLFRWHSLKGEIRFGLSVMLGALIWSLYVKVDVLIGGRYLSTESVGLYAVALHLATLLMSKTMPMVHDIALPAYSALERQKKIKSEHVVRFCAILSAVSFPAFFGLAAVAPNLVPLLLGQQWIDATTPMMLICLIVPLRFLLYALTPALTAIGKPHIEWQNHLVTLACLLVAIPIGAQHGEIGVALAWCLSFPIAFFVGLYRTTRALQLALPAILLSMLKPFVLSAIMAALVLGISQVSANSVPQWLTLALGVVMGVIFYIAGALLFNRATMLTLYRYAKSGEFTL